MRNRMASGLLRRDTSIYSKLMIMFIAVFIPLYFIAYFIINWGEEKNRREMGDALLATADRGLLQLEREMLRIDYYIDQITVAMAIRTVQFSLSHPDKYDQVGFMLEMKKFTGDVQTMNTFVDQVIVDFPDWNLHLASDSTIELIGNHLGEFSNGPLWKAINNRLFMGNYYSVNLPDGQGEEQFLLAAELSLSQLHSFLENIATYEAGGAMLISDAWDLQSERYSKDAKQMRDVMYAKAQQSDANKGLITDAAIDGRHYVAAFKKSAVFNSVMVVYVPDDEYYYPLKMYKWLFWIMTLLSLGIVILFTYWIYRVLHQPLQKLVGSFRNVERGQLHTAIEHAKNDEFRYIYGRFNTMVVNLRTLITEVYEQKMVNQQTELKRLQSQINPHFLYNNFFVLYRLIQSNRNKSASDFALYLGQHYEFLTRSDEDSISFFKEMNHVQNYVEIQRLLVEDRVQVFVEELQEHLKSLQVPKLIIQPIVENAYKYAFEEKLSNGLLFISFRSEDGYLIITVEDNGDGLTEEKLAHMRSLLYAEAVPADENTGLRNVHRRLVIRFGEDSGIRLHTGSLGGLLVEVRIPVGGEQ